MVVVVFLGLVIFWFVMLKVVLWLGEVCRNGSFKVVFIVVLKVSSFMGMSFWL